MDTEPSALALQLSALAGHAHCGERVPWHWSVACAATLIGVPWQAEVTALHEHVMAGGKVSCTVNVAWHWAVKPHDDRVVQVMTCPLFS